jgi:Tol biopolymer transport system component
LRAWSPDGRRIAFVSDFDDGTGKGWRTAVVIPIRLVRWWKGIGKGSVDRPEWSPVGREVTYGNWNNGQIYETTTHGRSVQITHGGMWKAEPVWSPVLGSVR